MPVVFLVLGILSLFLSAFSCSRMATIYGISCFIYFLLIILLIALEIGLGVYWVNHSLPEVIKPEFGTTITPHPTTFSNGTSISTTIAGTTVYDTTPRSSPLFDIILPEDFNEVPKNNSKLSVLSVKSFLRDEQWRSIQLEVKLLYTVIFMLAPTTSFTSIDH